MSQEHLPGALKPTDGARSGRPRTPLGLALVAIVALILLIMAVSLSGWPPAVRPAGAAVSPPALTDDPAQGLAGSSTQLSGQFFPRSADLTSNSVTFTFNNAAIPNPSAIVLCTGNVDIDFGYGPLCSSKATAFYPLFQIPAGTPPGSYLFQLVITDANGTQVVNVTAPFTVLAPATSTPTPSATATNTPVPATGTPTFTATPTATASATALSTGVPTAVSTNVPATGTATPTGTATSTPNATTPASSPTIPPTPTATATIKPIPNVPFVAIVRPDFDNGVLALALHAGPKATIHLGFTITTATGTGSTKTAFSLTRNGIASATGVYATTIKIPSSALTTTGTGHLMISETENGSTQTVKHTYRI